MAKALHLVFSAAWESLSAYVPWYIVDTMLGFLKLGFLGIRSPARRFQGKAELGGVISTVLAF
jgi:hypothetical protein